MGVRQYHFIHILALVMLFVIFLASLTSSQILLRNVRMDLTEKKLWTLSPHSEKLLQTVQEPISIKLFFSSKLAQQSPSVHRFSQRVRGLLLEIKKHAGDQIKIEIIDPEPFSEQEDRALSYGLRALAVFNDEPFYFGLAAENRSQKIEIIPSFSIQRQHQLEYDLIHLVHRLSQTAKPKLGITTSLPLDTGVEGLPAALEGRAKPFLIYQQLADNYELEFLEQRFDEVPADIKVLFIAHPKKLGARTLYALDQFVLRGGKALILVDPFCEISQLTNRQGKKLKGLSLSSDLAPLLKNWGITYDPRDIVADRGFAQTVIQQDRIRKSSIQRRYVLWYNVSQEKIAQDELITKGLSSISLATSGFFETRPDLQAEWTPLISSSTDAAVFSAQYIAQQTRTPDDLLSSFLSSKRSYVVAGKLSGSFVSAFDKMPQEAKRKKGSKRRTVRSSSPAPHLSKSKVPTDIILLADSDLLEKRFWIDLPTYYQQSVVVPTADNATFIVNALDALMGNEALIELRARAPQERSFTLVDQLRQQASQKLAAEEYRLRQNIQAIEASLAKLGKEGSQTKAGQSQLLDLERKLLSSRRALHEVRKQLNYSIETLGTWVKFFNILFVPLLLLLFIFITPWVKRRFSNV